MHRFFLPPDQCAGSHLWLGQADAHHAREVLRLGPGEPALVLDGAGNQYFCKVAECTHEQVRLAVERKETLPPPPCRVTLLQAVPKGKLLESIIQKATELGAYRIVPVLSERTNLRVDEHQAGHKLEKWQRVAIEAVKQCGACWLTRVDAPVTLPDFLARREPFELALLASLQPDSRHAGEYFQGFEYRNRVL